MSNSQYLVVFLGFLIAAAFRRGCDGETSTCLAVYKEGGAPAVFQSPKCPRWSLASHASSSPSAERCQLAMLQGRRYSQEDRALCALDLRIPFPGKVGIKEVVVGVVAVFDGHNGAEASDMASKLLLEYFVLHTYFLLDSTYSAVFKRSIGRLLHTKGGDGTSQLLDWDQVLGHYDLDLGRVKHSVPESLADSSHLEILKEALLRAIHDIDATFSKEASRKNLDSGTTATIILLADGQILVANIGDSKAFLCSEQIQSRAEAKATYLRLYRKERHSRAISHLWKDGKSKLVSPNGLVHFSVLELTRDHHPNRDDERFRVENAGGYVLEWGGVPRVNGQLAISRAIGDLPFKRYGVISAPELTDWRPVTVNDSYLVAASDGVFEKLSLQDVCDLLWEVRGHGPAELEHSVPCTYSLADCIVNTAFEKGSMDNVAAVVVPLAASTGFSENLLKEKLNVEGDNGSPPLGFKKALNDATDKKIISDIVQLKRAHPAMTKFERLLVEGKHGCIGCFYLSENLDERTDYTLQAEKVNLADVLLQENKVEHDNHNVPLPGVLDHYFSGPVNLYHDNNLCFHLGMTIGGAKEQCLNPEGFASFIGFLESVPFHDGGLNNGSFEYETPNLNYVLKKKFGRGSYGEVWLAFHWHCDQGSNSSEWSRRNSNESSDTIPFNSQGMNSSSFFHDKHSSSLGDNLFILKRIMVERGAATYLSGLREKYFGEVFLNASRCLGGSASARTLRSILKEPNFGFCNTIETDEVVNRNFENISEEKVGVQGGFYEEGLNHIARFVESFESRANEIWLAFHFEGISMSKLLYTLKIVDRNANPEGADDTKHAQMLHPSKWWHWLKTTEAGQEEMRSIIRQLLLALKSCHDRNITHRDIKPENMVICFKDQNNGRCFNKIPEENISFTTKMRIIDFGSAIDEFTVKHLYGSSGPSRAEQTSDYSPPEALLNASWHHGAVSTNLKYDMWSVGVVILELIIGSPKVFQISSYTLALLNQHLEGWNEGLKDLAYKLRSFMELCILVPGDFSKHHRTTGRVGVSPASWKCSEEFFSNQIKSRDPLKLGFPNVLLLRLVRHLLQWDPEERLSLDEALEHPYFKPRPVS